MTRLESTIGADAVGKEIEVANGADIKNSSYQAFLILKLAFVAAPILMGLDKFFNVLVDWEKYLAPIVPNILGGHGHEFMMAVGVIEIIAGIGVAIKPKYFSYVVAAWLAGIIVNILLTGNYFDVAFRDFGLMLGALALTRLAQKYD